MKEWNEMQENKEGGVQPLPGSSFVAMTTNNP